MSSIESSFIGRADPINSDLPSAASYGQINSEQKRLLGALRKDDLTPDEIRVQFLEKEEEKLSLLVENGKITEEEKQARLDKAESFIDKHISHVSEDDELNPGQQSTFPVDLVSNAYNEERRRAHKRRHLRRAEFANNVSVPNIVDYGKLTSEQWQLVRELKMGDLTAAQVREKYLANEEEKLNLLGISEEEKQRRLERFTSIIDKLIEKLSAK
jgi:hypothetical protein